MELFTNKFKLLFLFAANFFYINKNIFAANGYDKNYKAYGALPNFKIGKNSNLKFLNYLNYLKFSTLILNKFLEEFKKKFKKYPLGLGKPEKIFLFAVYKGLILFFCFKYSFAIGGD